MVILLSITDIAMSSWLVCIMFMELCNRLHYLLLEQFRHPRKKPCTLWPSSPKLPSSLSHWKPPVDFLSVDLLIMHILEWNQTL